MNSLTTEGMLDICILTFFRKIVYDSSSILFQVSMRQLALKLLSSNSWFIFVTKLAYKYNLPSPHSMLQNPIKATTWKRLVKRTVTAYWFQKL